MMTEVAPRARVLASSLGGPLQDVTVLESNPVTGLVRVAFEDGHESWIAGLNLHTVPRADRLAEPSPAFGAPPPGPFVTPPVVQPPASHAAGGFGAFGTPSSASPPALAPQQRSAGRAPSSPTIVTTAATRVVLYTASGISASQPHSAMTPEALLLALLQDPAIGQGDTAADERELFRVLLASDEKGDAPGGWSTRAWSAYLRAWNRAVERARNADGGARLVVKTGALGVSLVPNARMTPGDLLVGLSGSGDVVEGILERRPIDPRTLDAEVESPPPSVGQLEGVADDAPVDVLALNDDTTPMELVVSTLQDSFECSAVRAMWLMYTVHFRQRARVVTCSRAEAERRIAEAESKLRASGQPLTFACGPRA